MHTDNYLMKQKSYDTAVKQERAILVGVVTPDQTAEQSREYLDELEFLAMTAGAKTEAIFTQKMQRPERSTFVGTGKLEEIRNYCETDVVNTYLVYLRFQKMRGHMDAAAHQREVALVRETLEDMKEAHWREYLDAWRK